MSRAPNFKNPTTLDNVLELIRYELDNIFVLGEQSGERPYWGGGPLNPEKQIEESIQKISEKIDEFFIDNR